MAQVEGCLPSQVQGPKLNPQHQKKKKKKEKRKKTQCQHEQGVKDRIPMARK
jgi:hypothetical protein